MKLNQMIALHGNPGHPDDWRLLQTQLPEMISVDAYSNDWQELVRDNQGAMAGKANKVTLVGHSWGAYRILKALPGLKQHVEKVILLGPYVRPVKPLPALAGALLKTPWIGGKLIKSSHGRVKDSFIDELIYPFKIEGLPYYRELHSRFQDWKVWEKAALNKLSMQEDPLSEADICDVPIFVFFGAEDKISTEDAQGPVLKKYPLCAMHTLKGAGHGLLWSHAAQIAEKIKSIKPGDIPLTPPPAAESSSGHSPTIGYHLGSDIRNNVISYMEKHLREFPDRIALRWAKPAALAAWDANPQNPIAHDEISYRHFAARITSFAQGLAEIGIQKGDRVIIFLPMSLDMYTAMFAVQRIGAIAVFLDSWARSHHLGASADCVEPKAMISFKMAFDLVDQVPEFKRMPIRILYGPDTNMTSQFTHKFPDLLKGHSEVCPVESEFTALITFTTGSTGKPKGANRTHRFLSAQHRALSHVIPYTENDIDMPAFPIFSLNNLAGGVTTVIPALNLSAPSERDSALLACQILNEKINCTTLSPSMLVGLAKFCKENNIQLSKLRRVVTGGAPISKDDVKAFYEIAPQTELWILYGSTEAEPMAHIEGRDMLKENLTDPEIVEEGVNVGHISDDIDFKFIRIRDGSIGLQTDWQEIELPAGQVGEFICTGDHVCRDYYNNPEAFTAVKIMDSENRVWHRTGDLAYIDKNRNLWIVGRTNNAIERAGTYYFPVRAEVLLKRLDFVHRCAFLGVPDGPLGQATYLGQATCAVVELKADANTQTFDFEAARKEIHRVFKKNNIPVDQIKFVNKVPMDPRHHSKVEYKVLREQLNNPEVVIA